MKREVNDRAAGPNQGRDPTLTLGVKNGRFGDAIVKLIDELARGHSREDVFRDFVTMAAVALSKLDFAQAEEREKLYLQCAQRYSPEAMSGFVKMFALLQLGLEEPQDLLGEIFMKLELGSRFGGQFFTPYHVSELMAEIICSDDAKRAIAEHGYLTVSEPTCGAGGMIIAMAASLRRQGINYQRQMHVTAVDVDFKAAAMTYIQLSLLHIPAVIVHGNTLSLQEYSHWYTPAHILGNWSARLAKDHRHFTDPDVEADYDDEPGIDIEAPGQ